MKIITSCLKCDGQLLYCHNTSNQSIGINLYCNSCNLIYFAKDNTGEDEPIVEPGNDGMPARSVPEGMKFECYPFMGYSSCCCGCDDLEDSEFDEYESTPYVKASEKNIYYFDLNKGPPCGFTGCYNGSNFTFWEDEAGNLINIIA